MKLEDGVRLKQARANVELLCEEKGIDPTDPQNWQAVLREIDTRFEKRRYKCRRCWDTGIISWIGSDGMFHGSKCGACRYWDEQREKWRKEKQARGVKE